MESELGASSPGRRVLSTAAYFLAIACISCTLSIPFIGSLRCQRGWMGVEALNKGCIYGRKGSSPGVLKAYRQQFAEDFVMFLRSRSEEIIHGGRIFLCFMGAQDDEACPHMELTSIALYKLASQGRINKEKLDGFNLPLYSPNVEQVKQLIESEGSFSLHKLDAFAVSWVETMRSAKPITNSIRAMTESLLAGEFGEEIMDDVFHLVQEMVVHNIATGQKLQVFNLAVSLIRKSA